MLPVRPPWLSPRALLGGALATLAALSGPGSGPVRGEDAAKPDPPGVEAATRVQAADETAYAEEPYWYRPGHPLRPAEAKDIETRPGFVAEKLLTVPPELGSWIALTVDDRGRLIASAQHVPGLFRITPAAIGVEGAETAVERLSGAGARAGFSHGLLYAHDSLYVTVSEANELTPTGVYRLRDTDGDDEFDSMELLLPLPAAGEHGPHALAEGPGDGFIYLIGGNGLAPPEGLSTRRPVSTTGFDHLMPPGFGSTEHTTAGWVVRFRSDGSGRELMASGLRNAYDLAFNRQGDLFTWDSDMEWDLGAPWYRPTRICFLVSGAEFGWRPDAGKWPAHYEDSVAPVADIGPGSPTGLVFGYRTRFPPPYREALFAADWTFGAINAVHLRPSGATWTAGFEEFLGGVGLPVTDLAVGGDGALYFVVGGRRLGSAVYRVRYAGEVAPESPADSQVPALHRVRRQLEELHGAPRAGAVARAWPYLSLDDRAIRFAARVAVETQPVGEWRARALAESDPRGALTALLALARQGDPSDLKRVVSRVTSLGWDDISVERRLAVLRVIEVAHARGGEALSTSQSGLARWLRGRFPDGDELVDRELSRLLCALGDGSVVDPLLDRMAADRGERPFLGIAGFARNPKYGEAVRDMLESAPLVNRMHHAQMLLWLDAGRTAAQRRRYFELVADAKAHSKGGHTYRELWDRIREAALERVPEPERDGLAAIDEEQSAARAALAEGLPLPEGPGRDWSLGEALGLVGDGLKGRDYAHGKRTFAAAGCILCHPMGAEGGTIGPSLSTVGQRFTARDMLEAILEPSRTISDQYRVSVVRTKDGRTLSGRIVSRDTRATRLAENLRRPGQSTLIANDDIEDVQPVPVSTMPSDLLDPLSPEEVLDLLAYLAASGRPDADVFRH